MKYSAYLKKFEGLTVMLFIENGLCNVVANGDKSLNNIADKLGTKTMEIYKVHEDFIEFKKDGALEGEFLITTFPLERVVFEISNLNLSK